MDNYKDSGERFLAENSINIKGVLKILGLHKNEVFALTDGHNFHRLKFYFNENYNLMAIDCNGNVVDYNFYIPTIVLGYLRVVKW